MAGIARFVTHCFHSLVGGAVRIAAALRTPLSTSLTKRSVGSDCTAVDASAFANESFEPAGAPTLPHVFAVTVVDTAGPVVTATPIADDRPEGMDVVFTATVTDSSGVDSVSLFYRPTGGAFVGAAMTAVIMPMTAITMRAVGVKKGYILPTMNTPAATMVAAWISAETGVGPAMASGSHT